MKSENTQPIAISQPTATAQSRVYCMACFHEPDTSSPVIGMMDSMTAR